MVKKQRDNTENDPRRKLSAVSDILETDSAKELIADFSREQLIEAIRGILAGIRATLHPNDQTPVANEIVERARIILTAAEKDRIRPVVNACGVLLHTGLGRAILPESAAAALGKLHHGCNLQIDMETGLRGKRNHMSEKLIARLTGAEAALIVNNNAGATLLLLAALCQDREVVVSRGQLIEIGGSYRLTDCILRSGAKMIEVGTTNKTHLRDYENALTENTAALLRVNPSNYRVIGFSQSVPVSALVKLKQNRDLLVIDDLGCGALIDMRRFGLPYEPTVPDSIAAGADLACFSGDKLIGGPQAGIIVGRTELIEKIRKHPLTRMLRVGKLTDTALEHTLRLFLEPEKLPERHPVIRMLTICPEKLRQMANKIKQRIEKDVTSIKFSVIEGHSEVGGGSFPGTPLPTFLLALKPEKLSAEELCRAMRLCDTPVIARIKNEQVLLDMRTLLPDDEEIICEILANIEGKDL